MYLKILNLESLKECFLEAKEQKTRYIAVVISNASSLGDEIIINPAVNIDAKLNYYLNAYNENLTLKSAPNIIKITGFASGDSFEEIQWNLRK